MLKTLFPPCLFCLPASAAVLVKQTVQSHPAFTGSFVRESNIGVAAFNNGIYGSQGNQGGFILGQLEAATAGSNTASISGPSAAFPTIISSAARTAMETSLP